MLALRPVNARTIHQAIELAGSLFPSQHEEIVCSLSRSILPKEQWDPEWAAMINHLHYELAHAPDGIIGITGMYEECHNPTIAWLGWFGILPSYRRHKLGRMLLEHTIATARKSHYKCFRIWALDHPDYHNAIELYRKSGFIEQIPSYQLAGLPVMIFSLPLRNEIVPLWDGARDGLHIAGAHELLQPINQNRS